MSEQPTSKQSDGRMKIVTEKQLAALHAEIERLRAELEEARAGEAALGRALMASEGITPDETTACLCEDDGQGIAQDCPLHGHGDLRKFPAWHGIQRYTLWGQTNEGRK